MSGTVLVLGAHGVFGAAAVKAFAEAGWEVRRYDRKAGNMAAAAQGADVIVNALNPPAYHDWKTLLPTITREVIAAAKASGATVLLPGNVYVYGDQAGPWSEATPHLPVARKGRIRAAVEADYRRAASEGVRVIVLRGGDFIAPGNPRTVMEMVMLKRVAQGKLTAMGAPGAVRAYAYIPDMARAAVALAEKRQNLSPYEDVPFPGVSFSMTELAAEVERQSKRKMRVGRFAWWLMALAAPVWELARELREMRYLYDTPHRLDGAKFRALVPEMVLTGLPEIVTEVLEARASRQGDVDSDEAMA